MICIIYIIDALYDRHILLYNRFSAGWKKYGTPSPSKKVMQFLGQSEKQVPFFLGLSLYENLEW